MKNILSIVFIMLFGISVSYADNDLGYSKNFISYLKEKARYVENGQHEIAKLDRKVNNYFEFIGILRQDWTDELEMSLRSKIGRNSEKVDDRLMD